MHFWWQGLTQKHFLIWNGISTSNTFYWNYISVSDIYDGRTTGARSFRLQRSGHFSRWDATVLFTEILPDRSSHLSQARPDGNARLHLWALPSDRTRNIWLRRDCRTDSALWFPAECPRSHLLPPPGQWFLWRPLSESDCQCLWTPRRKSPFRFSPVW